MAGIFGYFTLSKHYLDKDRLADMTRLMKLQGYGIAEVIYDNACLLGKTDFQSAGVEQPPKKGAEINIAVSGEIYNGDIEKSILTLYREGKLDQLKTLNGSFAAAIYDKTTEKLTLVNDRCGLIRVFYYRDGDRFCFAPRIKPLLRLGVDKSLREGAIADFFLFGYFLGDKTFFEHIHQLPPASILEISQSGMNLTKYWDCEYAEEYDARPKEELIDELGELWQRAVERRIKKDGTIIIPLSGGLDSRGILTAALKCTSKDNIITCTFAEKGSYDFEIGRIVARKAGVKNIPLGVEKDNFEEQYNLYFGDTEGMCDATPIFPPNRYAEVSKIGNRILSGYRGDALMGDHVTSEVSKIHVDSYESLMRYGELLLATSVPSSSFEAETKNMLNQRYLKQGSTRKSLQNTLSEIYEEGAGTNLADILQMWEFRHLRYKYEMTNVFRFQHLFDYICPICDSELVDFMLKVPPHLRLNENLYKSMLLKKYPELFGLPVKSKIYGAMSLASGNTPPFLTRAIRIFRARAIRMSTRLVQRNIFQNKGKNYIDYDDLLRRNKEYKDFVRRMIDKVEEREYFDKDYIEGMWRLHMQGKKNYWVPFGYLVTFGLFLERFVDE